MNGNRIFCFGDSITYGAWDIKGGWADRLRCHFHELAIKSNFKQVNQVLNLGIGGETSTGLLSRLNNELDIRMWKSWNAVIVIAIGINDSRINDDSNKPENPVDTYKQNLIEIVTKAQSFSGKILLIGLTPLDVDNLQFKTHTYRNDLIQLYDAVQEQVASELNVSYLKLFDKVASKSVFFQDMPDHLHPGTEGRRWLFKQIKPKVIELMNS